MGQNYITKYECPECQTLCDSYDSAANHCLRTIEEVYICEFCGYETNDDSDAVSDCEYHH